ncbi:hypothetical protein [Variovorax sp. PBL-E5]|uniref:hypothetical protein n=1 Tax=Variovorax sp. PBL-E5 TaxID=434014 RepID=UPI0013186821|nr:hypothetical protein [Variovorax sp. PBL-E5]VTU28034.1 hypothetical protein E5CHR_02526 [Variovorax sp. PBL-E5]
MLVLTEGVVQHWIVDYFSPQMMRFRDRPAIRRGMQNAPWRFRPEDCDRFPLLLLLLRSWIRLSWPLSPPDKRDALMKMAGYVVFEQA